MEERTTQDEMNAIMQKYDKESNTRIWSGVPKKLYTAFLALFSLYCMYMTLFSTVLPEIRLSRFLALIIIAGYLTFPMNKSRVRPNHVPVYDIVLMLLGAGAFMYFALNAMDIINLATRIKPHHVWIGVVGILVLMELCRRSVGLPILVICSLLIAFAFYNQMSFNPNLYQALKNIIFKLFYSTNGVIGTPTNVCYTYIVLFIIFGAFLERTNIANFFIAFANRIAGWSSGGPAKVAVISSALCGMVSGSSVGNTVTTGSITIPMMKRTGYRPEFAGAVEATASTGGQIMPPIMGAAAFLMAEYIGIPYAQVAMKAILPAFLYFLGIFIAVHLEAKKLNLKGIPVSELPKWSYLAKNCYLILPLILLITLVATGARTMAWSAAFSIFAAILIGFINLYFSQREERRDESASAVLVDCLKRTLFLSIDALSAGSKGAITVAVACGMAGIIAGCITVTGLASILINLIVNLAGSITIIGLFLTMLCCIVLGMGVPTTANYCIMASTCAPILIQLGFSPVSAHFFVFYFGIVADITPPVALAAFAGAAIAKASPMRTGFNATKLAIAAFIIPYIFAYSPIMLLEGVGNPIQLIQVIITSVLGLFAIAAALNGHLFRHIPAILRIALIAAGLMMMVPGTFTDLAGLLVIGAIFILMNILSRRSPRQA